MYFRLCRPEVLTIIFSVVHKIPCSILQCLHLRACFLGMKFSFPSTLGALVKVQLFQTSGAHAILNLTGIYISKDTTSHPGKHFMHNHKCC